VWRAAGKLGYCGRIYDCSLDNGATKHSSPTTNQAITQQLYTLHVNRESNSRMLLRYSALAGSVSVTMGPLQNVFSLQSARRLYKGRRHLAQLVSACSDSDQPGSSPEAAINQWTVRIWQSAREVCFEFRVSSQFFIKCLSHWESVIIGCVQWKSCNCGNSE
jgi:hypothetical protein